MSASTIFTPSIVAVVLAKGAAAPILPKILVLEIVCSLSPKIMPKTLLSASLL
jgi:hypothetical protein